MNATVPIVRVVDDDASFLTLWMEAGCLKVQLLRTTHGMPVFVWATGAWNGPGLLPLQAVLSSDASTASGTSMRTNQSIGYR